MYETTKELILAQRAQGLDCGLIDASKPDVENTDGDLKTESPRYADGADIYVLHSHIPQPWWNDGTPTILMLHGMPRYSWETELYLLESENSAPFATLCGYFNSRDIVSRHVTLWAPHFAVWDVLDNYSGRVRMAPNGVDLTRYSLDGPEHDLAGEPKLLVADSARMCKDPYNCAFGAEWFRAKFAPEAKLHFVGMPPRGAGSRVRERWDELIGATPVRTTVGNFEGIQPNLEEWYRSCDILLTTAPDESRVVKEALACGMDVLSPNMNTAGITKDWVAKAHGETQKKTHEPTNHRPPTKAAKASQALIERELSAPIWSSINFDDAQVVGEAIQELWTRRKGDPARRQLLRRFAEARYDIADTARHMIGIYEEVFAEAGGQPLIEVA